MTRLRHGFGGQARLFVCGAILTPLLSGCSGVAGQVQDTLSGALAPVKGAIDETARRANEVGEGINQVSDGIQRVQGALSGSGSRF